MVTMITVQDSISKYGIMSKQMKEQRNRNSNKNKINLLTIFMGQHCYNNALFSAQVSNSIVQYIS